MNLIYHFLINVIEQYFKVFYEESVLSLVERKILWLLIVCVYNGILNKDLKHLVGLKKNRDQELISIATKVQISGI